MKKTLLLVMAIVFGLVLISPEASRPTHSAIASGTPTFNKEVVRIMQQNCQTCHHPGYIAPFSLMDYADAKTYAAAIKNAVTERRMPPWKAAGGCGDFNDARILTPEQINTIVKWVDAGAPEGDAADLPPPLTFPDGWMLGEPELALRPSEAYTLGANGDDVYRCFVMPHVFDQDTYVTAAEILPDNTKVVHHVLLFLDGKGDSLKLDANDPGPGYT